MSSGVYLMKDSTGCIIYVGKAKNLKRRVKSYFYQSKNHSPKVVKLIKQIKDIDIILTDTEFEAFMLECKLIKELKPFFNSMMKNPLAYVYLTVNMNSSLPEIVITNEAIEKDGYYCFGPFTNKNTVRRAMEGIKDLYKINCSNTANKNSACINYSLNLCIGMCRGEAEIALYREIIRKIISLFTGSDTEILEELKKKMEAAAEVCQFEAAVKWRECINAVQSLIHKEQVIQFIEENKYILTAEYVSPSVIKWFLIYRNEIIWSKKFILPDNEFEPLKEEIKRIMLSHDNHSYKTGRNEIDEAQIIYHFLKKGGNKFLVLHADGNQQDFAQEINEKLFELMIKG